VKVTDILLECKDIFEERNKVYGDAYKTHGDILCALFPKGIVLTTPEDFNKMSLIFAITGKLSRIANNFNKGHKDSCMDLINFSAMLAETYDDLKHN